MSTDFAPSYAGSDETYERLIDAFSVTHERTGGGGSYTYITGEQCVSRLNEVLGYAGWSFTIREHGINAEADEAWCRGRMTVIAPDMPGGIAVREQFGSQKIKRARSSGVPVDIGFDLKGAATDCLKRCAVSFGVALYLYERESAFKLSRADEDTQPPRQQPQRQAKQPSWQQLPDEKHVTAYTAEDEALEDQAKQNKKPRDLAYLASLGQVRQAANEAKLRGVAQTVSKDIELRPDRAEVWTKERQLAVKHLLADCAHKLGFRWTSGNGSTASTAANPGPQGAPVATGAV